MEMVPLLSLVLIIFYSGELIWKERERKFDGIINSTPAQNWTFFFAKLTTLALLPMVLITAVIIVCVGFQLSTGHYNIEFGNI